MSIHTVTITIDINNLSHCDDTYLASLWHVAQANPADISDLAAGKIAEAIGREIIRRFLAATPAELYTHQGHHATWYALKVQQGNFQQTTAVAEPVYADAIRRTDGSAR